MLVVMVVSGCVPDDDTEWWWALLAHLTPLHWSFTTVHTTVQRTVQHNVQHNVQSQNNNLVYHDGASYELYELSVCPLN